MRLVSAAGAVSAILGLAGCATHRNVNSYADPQPGAAATSIASAPAHDAHSPPTLVRSAEAVDAKIARKEARLAAGGKKPGGAATGARDAMEFRRQMRLDDNGEIPHDALLRAKEQAELVPELEVEQEGIADAGIWSWEWLGPGNIGGRVRAICFTDNDTIFLGGVAGGIWRSDDTGASWTALTDFLPSMAVTSIVVDPNTPTRLFAATGEGFGNSDALPGAGVFRTTTNGVIWTQLPDTAGWTYTNRLAIDPNDGNHLLAATNTGIYRTVNGGDDWTLERNGNTSDLKFHPTDGQKAVAAAGNTALYTTNGGDTWNTATWSGVPGSTTVRVDFNSDFNTNDDTLEVNNAGIFNAGDMILVGILSSQETATVQTIVDSDTITVTDLALDHPISTLVTLPPQGRVELAYAPSNPNIVYASMDAGGGTIWKSNNGGQTYTVVSNPTDNYLGGQGWYDNAIWVGPDDANLVVVGGIDLWRSTNGGSNITRISDWHFYDNGTSAHADNHIIVAPPNYSAANRRVYFGNDGGIQSCANIYTVGQTSGWTNLADYLGITQFYGGAASPTGSYVLGGTQDNSTVRFRPADGANAWYMPFTGDGGSCAIDPNNTAIQYAEWQFLNFMKSTNGGQSFGGAATGLSDAGSRSLAPFIAPFVMDPNNSAVLIAGGTSVWRTTNSAGIWAAIRGATTGSPKVSAIDIAVGNTNRVWVGYQNGRVSRTTSSITTWTDVDDVSGNAIPERWVTDIAINPANEDEVFVTIGGYQTDSVWFTPDGGDTWELRTGTGENALPAVQVNTIRFHPLNQNWVYIGTDIGIFASENKGLTWSRTPRFEGVGHEGPTNTEVAELFWQGTSHLLAATHGRGMYRVRPFVVVYVDKANAGFEDGSAANPFNTVDEGESAAGPGTTISIEADVYDEAGTTVLNKRGRVISTNGTSRIQ